MSAGVRVERCIGDDGDYAPGWIVLYGMGDQDYCIHETFDLAIDCALWRAAILEPTA